MMLFSSREDVHLLLSLWGTNFQDYTISEIKIYISYTKDRKPNCSSCKGWFISGSPVLLGCNSFKIPAQGTIVLILSRSWHWIFYPEICEAVKHSGKQIPSSKCDLNSGLTSLDFHLCPILGLQISRYLVCFLMLLNLVFFWSVLWFMLLSAF